MSDITLEELTAATGGRYIVKSIIGAGGMGTVYLAEHRDLGSKVAIKVLPPEVRLNPVRMARFTREAGLSARLSHPNLVQAFELETFDDIVYLVMPFIEGVALDQYLEEHGALDRLTADTMVQQIGGGLSYAHGAGIVHRDVKPANILFETATRRWLLTDFGVAHVASANTTELTASDATIGTLAYMAPEQLGGAREADGRADCYSLATVMYEALTTQLPDRDGPERCAQALSATRPDLPLAYCRAVTRPLATARDERPASVQEWLGLVARPGKPAMGRRVLLAAAVFTLAALGAGIGIWNLVPANSDPQVPTVAVMPFQVTGPSDRIDLDSILSQAVAWQLQTLPGLRVVEDATVHTTAVNRYGAEPLTAAARLDLARRLNADQYVVGSATTHNDSLALRIEVYDVSGGRFTAGQNRDGPLDSLHSLISDLVVATFGTQLAEQLSGAESPSLPRGVPAVSAYFEGDRAFRRGHMEAAVASFNRVITLDSTYAPAYFKRVVATIFQLRPTAVAAEIRTALDAAEAHRERLDPMSRRLLTGYSTLIRVGDFQAADSILRGIIDDYADAVDAWFLLGALQAWFPVQIGSSPQEARITLDEVLRRDPFFAAAHGLLFQIAAGQNDLPTAHFHRDKYLAIDSITLRAETIRLADSLIAHPLLLPRMLGTFASRPNEVLENLAVAAGELRPPEGTRPIASRALDLLIARSGTLAERAVTFRMRLATYLGSGQDTRAREFLRDAASMGIPASEVDRWTVLSQLTPATPLAPDHVEDAAYRLAGARDATSLWLAARWLRDRDSVVSRRAADSLQNLPARNSTDAVLAASLAHDLRAQDLFEAGDTDGAIAVWTQALSHSSVEEILFGLVGSLWPLRWDLVTAYRSAGRWDDAIAELRLLTRRAGFIDQAIWAPVLLELAKSHLARGDTVASRAALADLYYSLRFADGAGALMRDSIGAVLTVN